MVALGGQAKGYWSCWFLSTLPGWETSVRPESLGFRRLTHHRSTVSSWDGVPKVNIPSSRLTETFEKIPLLPPCGGDAGGRGGSAFREPYLVIIRRPPLCHSVTSLPARGGEGIREFPSVSPSCRASPHELQPGPGYLAKVTTVVGRASRLPRRSAAMTEMVVVGQAERRSGMPDARKRWGIFWCSDQMDGCRRDAYAGSGVGR